MKTKDGYGNRVSMNSAAETIRCKTKGNGKCMYGTPAAASSATSGSGADGAKGGDCALCKKYSTNSPHAWKAHLTKYCKE